MLSVVCPIYNEEKYIAQCVESILKQDYPKEELEVIFADGMSTDRTRDILAEYISQYSWIRLIDNPERIVPAALNRAITSSRGDIIMRLDAHAYYPTNYFSRLSEALRELNADNVGGVCITLPAADTNRAMAIADVLSSRFGMGNSDFRVGASEVKLVDTVPFGCWPREVFNRIGLFDQELIRNQDDEFNGRITKSGGKIYLIPDVEIKYFARAGIKNVARMFYQYGLFKPLVNKKLGSPATVRQFVPLALVVGLIVSLPLSIAWPWFSWLYVFGIGLYVGLCFFCSLGAGKGIKRVVMQAMIYMIVHISYGWGYLVGLWKLLIRQSFVASVNR